MSKAVLISIKPKWCELIASGKKTIEVRKNHPKIDTPFKCYIYQTKVHLPGYIAFGGIPADVGGKIMGEFICDDIMRLDIDSHGVTDGRGKYLTEKSSGLCLSREDIFNYSGIMRPYGWHISNLKMYDKPKELSIFHKPVLPLGLRYEDDVIKRPPQSWCYVEALKDGD